MNKVKNIIILIFAILFVVSLPNFSKATVSVGKVKNLRDIKIEAYSATVKWNTVSKATAYQIYMYSDSKGKYEYYKTTSTNSIKLTNLKSSKRYKIKVRAYKKVNGKKYHGSFSSILKFFTKPKKIKSVTMKSTKQNSIQVSWNRAKRVDGYKVYIMNEKTKKWDYYGKTKTNSINITNLQSSKIYEIRVRAYRQIEDRQLFGEYSANTKIVTLPESTTGLKVKTNTSTNITITWNKVARAEKYKVYRYNEKNKNWDYCGKTKDLLYNLTDINLEEGYKFRVRAYINLEGTQYFGGYSNILSLITTPDKVSGLKVINATTNSIKIDWDKVNKADGYAVYIYNKTGQSIKEYKATTETTMNITGLDEAKFYKICVKAYIISNNIKYYGASSDIIAEKTKSTAKAKAGIDVSQHQGKIDWQEVKDMEVDFAIIRLGWIGNKNNHTIDTQFERNYNECKRLGIPVGIYVYCYSNCPETAKSGAEWTLKKLENKKIDLPVFIDMEDSSIVNTGKENLTNICVAFNNIISKSGFTPGIYANKNWFTNYLNSDLKSKYVCWVAHYTNSETVDYEGQYKIWQYSSEGSVNGIVGNVDIDIMYI